MATRAFASKFKSPRGIAPPGSRSDEHATSVIIGERPPDDLLDGIDIEAKVRHKPPRTH
jgi:hypothetical protein